MSNRVLFYIPAGVHLLDLAGMVQVFYEARQFGKSFEILFISEMEQQESAVNLYMTHLIHPDSITIIDSDIVVVPGFNIDLFNASDFTLLITFLKMADKQQATICSVCTAAFALARAGILNQKECTTHWRYTELLQAKFPLAQVKKNRLFTKSGNVYTSAGICTGIDLALFIIEERFGAKFAYQLAKELVVYIRRDGLESQESIYLQNRQHINSNIHEVQDWMIHNLDKAFSNEDLAALVHMSPRNLTRLFKSTTGITIGQYLEKLRAEKALQLLREDYKLSSIPSMCGLKSIVQLRQIIKRHSGSLPSALQ